MDRALAIRGGIFTTLIYEITQSPKSQAYDLVINWVEFAQGWDVEKRMSKYLDITLKGALRWDSLTERSRELRVFNLNTVNPAAERVKQVKRSSSRKFASLGARLNCCVGIF